MRYFDTSALMPYYRSEPTSERCEELLLESHGSVLLSDLVEVEFASVLARLVRMQELTEDEAVLIHQDFREDLAKRWYRRTSLEPAHVARARDWLLMRITRLRTLDALHLATAAHLGAELVTGDETLAEAAKRLGVLSLYVG